jgi:3-isopropylmalate dehydrogenase
MIRIAVLPGDGIGPEVIQASLPILQAAAKRARLDLAFETALVGGAAYDATGHPLPAATLKLCDSSAAIFFGAVGGPQYDKIPNPNLRPERGALLPLRKRYELYANLRPAKIFPGLEGQSHLKPEYLKGLDLLVIRELTGGAYFGKKELKKDSAYDVIAYTRKEIERTLHFAFKAALGRSKRLTLVHKANVLLSSVLWKQVAEQVKKKYPQVAMDECYVDAFTMFLIRRPASFDVVVTENMMGDIITDEAAEVTGSIGLLPSASLGVKRTKAGIFGLYEPCHGSAPDIAGKGLANPLATILSAAMLLRYSLSAERAARSVEAAVAKALADGLRTRDLAGPKGRAASTQQMGEAVLERLLKAKA